MPHVIDNHFRTSEITPLSHTLTLYDKVAMLHVTAMTLDLKS